MSDFPTVKTITTTEIIILNAKDTLLDAIKTLAEHKIKNVIVVSNNPLRYHYFGNNDIIRYVNNNLSYDTLLEGLELHTLLTVTEDYSIFEASTLFLNDQSIIGVTDANDELIGILTHTDFLSYEHLHYSTLDTHLKEIMFAHEAATATKESTLENVLPTIHSVPTQCLVVIENSEPVGIVTKGDIVSYIAQGQSLKDTVEHMMHAPIHTVETTISLSQAINLIQLHKHLIVTGGDGKLIGVLTKDNLISIVYNKLANKNFLSAEKLNHLLEEQVKVKTKELYHWKERFELAIKGSSDGVWDWNVNTNEILISENWLEMLGLQDEPTTWNIHDWIARLHPQDAKRIAQYRMVLFQNHKKKYEIEYRIKNSRGTYIWAKDKGHIVYTDDLKLPQRIISTVTDISEYKHIEAKLEYLANYDTLTNIANRTFFTEQFKHVIAKATRGSHKFALVMLDLDNFKNINDLFGHGEGDKVLQEVAKRFHKTIRESDIIARLGGDEFISILDPIQNVGNITTVLNKIKTIFDAPFRIAHQDLRVSASMGIAIYPDDGKTTLELLKNSETAMYQAKEQGKDQHAFFASVTNEEVRQRLQHEKELRKAIENETLSVLYQPTIDVAEEKVIEFEALVRWNKAPKELQHAETIAEFAKENNLPLDMYVIKQVLNQLQTWQEDGKPLYPISINLNNNTIEADDFYNDLAALKEQYGELFHYLTFEILITDNLHIIQEVAGLGVHITLDKFGKDSLFLQEMATFPVDTIKVDASLIQSIETNATAIKLLSAMVAMSNAFGVKISAVGVEALQEKELISTLGFDQYQGHYFSKAVSSEQIEEGLH